MKVLNTIITMRMQILPFIIKHIEFFNTYPKRWELFSWIYLLAG